MVQVTRYEALRLRGYSHAGHVRGDDPWLQVLHSILTRSRYGELVNSLVVEAPSRVRRPELVTIDEALPATEFSLQMSARTSNVLQNP